MNDDFLWLCLKKWICFLLEVETLYLLVSIYYVHHYLPTKYSSTMPDSETSHSMTCVKALGLESSEMKPPGNLPLSFQPLIQFFFN